MQNYKQLHYSAIILVYTRTSIYEAVTKHEYFNVSEQFDLGEASF